MRGPAEGMAIVDSKWAARGPAWGEGAVLGVHRPAVVAHADHVAAGGDHRLDGEDHALLEGDALVWGAVVGDLGLLVHLAADAVADEGADDGEALGLDVLLDGVRD